MFTQFLNFKNDKSIKCYTFLFNIRILKKIFSDCVIKILHTYSSRYYYYYFVFKVLKSFISLKEFEFCGSFNDIASNFRMQILYKYYYLYEERWKLRIIKLNVLHVHIKNQTFIFHKNHVRKLKHFFYSRNFLVRGKNYMSLNLICEQPTNPVSQSFIQLVSQPEYHVVVVSQEYYAYFPLLYIIM